MPPRHESSFIRLGGPAPPERGAGLYLRGPRPSPRVEPRGVGVALPVDLDRLVARLALPGADRVGIAVDEVLRVDALDGEVVIVLDDDGVIALGQRRAVPDRPHRSSFA